MSNPDKELGNLVYKTDLRVVKTHQALSKSLLSLLTKQSFDQINVKTICDEAMVSRSSFYSHFEDKYHLLLFCFEEAAEEIKIQSDISERDWYKVAYITNILIYVNENKQFMKLLFNQVANVAVRKSFEQVWFEELSDYLRKRAEVNVPSNTSELRAVFLAAGITRTIYWWVETDCQIALKDVEDYLVSMILY